MFLADLQMAKCCLLELAENVFVNANPLSKQMRAFLGPEKKSLSKAKR